VAFILYGLTHRNVYPQWLIWLAAVATAISLPVSVSRTAWFMAGGVVAWAVIGGVLSPRRLPGMLKVIFILVPVVTVALQFEVFRQALGSSRSRWDGASLNEGDFESIMSTRVFGIFAEGFKQADWSDWFGRGIGQGSNVAAFLETGERRFMVSEAEWSRVVLECGPIIGFALLGFRVAICLWLVGRAVVGLRRNDSLSWILVAAAVPVLGMMPMEQPTFLGFMIWGAGLCFAAAKPRLQRTDLRARLASHTRPLRVRDASVYRRAGALGGVS
jgi:hypothetical protein